MDGMTDFSFFANLASFENSWKRGEREIGDIYIYIRGGRGELLFDLGEVAGSDLERKKKGLVSGKAAERGRELLVELMMAVGRGDMELTIPTSS